LQCSGILPANVPETLIPETSDNSLCAIINDIDYCLCFGEIQVRKVFRMRNGSKKSKGRKNEPRSVEKKKNKNEEKRRGSK